MDFHVFIHVPMTPSGFLHLYQVWTVECGSEREGAEEDVFAVDVKLRAHARDCFQVCTAGVMECYRVVCHTAK